MDNMVIVSGGTGSGKTNLSINYFSFRKLRCGLVKYYRDLCNYYIKNFFFKIIRKKYICVKPIRPVFMSNIPVFKGRNCITVPFDFDVILMKKKLPNYSVLFLSEAGKYLDQYLFQLHSKSYGLDKAKWLRVITDYFSTFRHYTLGGYCILDDQTSERIYKEVRSCCGNIFNLSGFRHFGKLWSTHAIKLLSNESGVTVVSNNIDYGDKIYGFWPLFWKSNYDSYCFSERVKDVPMITEIYYDNMKNNEIYNIRDFLVGESYVNYSNEGLKKKLPKFDIWSIVYIVILFIVVCFIMLLFQRC